MTILNINLFARMFGNASILTFWHFWIIIILYALFLKNFKIKGQLNN